MQLRRIDTMQNLRSTTARSSDFSREAVNLDVFFSKGNILIFKCYLLIQKVLVHI